MQNDDDVSNKIITFHTINSKVTFHYSKESGFRKCSPSPLTIEPLYLRENEQDRHTNATEPVRRCSVCDQGDCDLSPNQHDILSAQFLKLDDMDGNIDLPSPSYTVNNPSMELCSSSVDPFGQFPVRMSLEMQEAYRNFYAPWNGANPAILEYHLYPTPRFRVAMVNAQHDSACFIALLATATIQSSLARSPTVSNLGIRLHRAAISLQATACQTDGPTDTRILSALCILFSELAMGGLINVAPLFRSISSLVSQRGGIKHLGMEGGLAGDLLLTDFALALVNYTPPLLKLPHRVVDVPQINKIPLGTAFFELPISHSVLALLRDFAFLLEIYTRACRNAGSPAEAEYFVYLCEIIEQRTAELNAAYRDVGTLEALLICAVALIDVSILRYPGKIRTAVNSLEGRFWTHYERMRATPDLVSNRGLDLWLVFTGTIISVVEPSVYEDKAVGILGDMVQHSGLSGDFSELMPMLNQYIWCEPVQMPSCRALLDKAAAAVSHSDT